MRPMAPTRSLRRAARNADSCVTGSGWLVPTPLRDGGRASSLGLPRPTVAQLTLYGWVWVPDSAGASIALPKGHAVTLIETRRAWPSLLTLVACEQKADRAGIRAPPAHEMSGACFRRNDRTMYRAYRQLVSPAARRRSARRTAPGASWEYAPEHGRVVRALLGAARQRTAAAVSPSPSAVRRTGPAQ